MGWALVEPGRLRRGRALAIEARRSLEIILGTAPWLVVAGLAEGFVSRAVDSPERWWSASASGQSLVYWGAGRLAQRRARSFALT